MVLYGKSYLVIFVESMLNVYGQLLYQPFTPYFAIFANIISNPCSADCFTDLQLLRKVVLYFLQMHNNHQSAKRLEKAAETFTRLAEGYVRQSMQSMQPPKQEESLDRAETPPSSVASGMTTVPSSADSCYPDFDSLSQTLPSLPFSPNDHIKFMFDDLDSDSMTLLNFFSHSDSNMTSAGSFMTGSTARPAYLSNFGTVEQQYPSGSSDWLPQPLIRDLENIAQNYGLEGSSFDWLSWDQYDVSMT